jgi:hypothetical protein
MRKEPGVAIWTMPVTLGLLTGIGLVAGLVADGFGDAVSWAGLGLPLLVIVWYVWLAPRSS